MHTSLFKTWLLRGTILVGLSCFGACSGEPAGSNNNTTGGGQCTANTATDPQNCGSCGRACTVGQACVGGACTTSCVAPQTNCGGVCADTANNALHCGGCGMACGAGQICQNNMCITGSCPGGQQLCAGACVDTQTNTAACGASCTACLIGQTCQAGVCTGGNSSGGAGGTGNTTGGAGGSGNTTGGTGGSDPTGGTGGSDPTGGTGGTGSTTDCRIWMAPNGSDSANGSEGTPVQTLQKAYDLLCPPPANAPNGTECTGPAPRTICAKPGTYAMNTRFEFRKTRMGTANNRIILQGDPASTQKPVFDFDGQPDLDCGENPDNRTGITINAHYVTVKNIEVTRANDNCILVQGAYGVVENVVTHHCADTGIQISSGDPFQGSGTNNTILNCDSYSNYDVQCQGENADGFAIKEGTGAGNAFIGCRAWDNTDDGYDFYAWTSPVRLENSWAFAQCETTEDSGSDCNGFKLGGNNVNTNHTLIDLIAVGNSGGDPGAGFNENTNPANLTCSGTCAAWDNDIDVDSVSGVSTNPIGNANITNMRAASARNADGSLKAPSEL